MRVQGITRHCMARGHVYELPCVYASFVLLGAAAVSVG